MSVLVDKDTRLLVQGITGKFGGFHAKLSLDYGTTVAAGVTPGKGGQIWENQVPVFNTVKDAVENEGVNATAIFVPPAFALDSIMEAIDAEIPLIVVITEGIPVQDMALAKVALAKSSCRLIGPNCPGVITPDQCRIGIMPGYIHKPGRVGVISRSGTLTYEAVWQLTVRGHGQSTCIGIGGDPINGTSHTDAIKLFNDDPDTDAIIMIGEIGGSSEEKAAAYIRDNVAKPVAAFIAGTTAPPGRRMGHAGAIVSGSSGSAESKIAALQAAGVAVAETPSHIADALLRIYQP